MIPNPIFCYRCAEADIPVAEAGLRPRLPLPVLLLPMLPVPTRQAAADVAVADVVAADAAAAGVAVKPRLIYRSCR